MQNYHKHTSYSTIFTPFKDSLMTNADYAKRAVELGQEVLSSVEHGYQGNWFRCWETAQEYGLKFVFGTEAYFVADRTLPDDRNAHIVLLARTHDGIRQLNHALSEANRTGFYSVPRLDLSLIREICPDDVLVTTACVAHWGKVDKKTDELVMDKDAMETFDALYKHLEKSLRLEVQAHNTKWQKSVNRICQRLSYEYDLPLIAGLDSHYIRPEQYDDRKYLRIESGIKFKDEDHEINTDVYEDYPDDDTEIARFRKQGVLTDSEILGSMEATNELLNFDEIVLDRSRKLPTIYPELSQEERNQKYADLVDAGWQDYKQNVPQNRWQEYEEAIEYEKGIITSTNVSDYFLIDAELVRRGKELGGLITPTGRGSCGGFFTNTLLGLSTLDRLSLPVKLYPERFVTAERLQTSLPDLDMNLAAPAPFVQAQMELMGEGHAYPFVAYGTLKTKAAFKLYARAVNISPNEANTITTQIDQYEMALKHTEDEDERDTISISDYVDEKYIPYIDASKQYQGIIVSKSQAPCGYLIYNGDIEREIGLLRVTDTKGNPVYCTVVDGYTAEAFGYVKNDLLCVSVIAVNSMAMRKAELPQYTSKEIIEITKNDAATWNLFCRGLTAGINQCQKPATTQKLMEYKPRCLEDLSAFVAAIRPGFKSQIQMFLRRNRFSYGISPFDNVLKNDSTGSSWMLYQENAMTAMNMAGIPMTETYTIIKAISKKKISVIMAAKERFITGFAAYIKHVVPGTSDDKATSQAEVAWQVIEDSASYSFNAAHGVAVALDALYGAYLKVHYPLQYYTSLLDVYADTGKTDKIAQTKAEMRSAFNIRILPCRFHQDNRTYAYDENENTVYDVLHAMKSVGVNIANELYDMRDMKFDSFIDLLIEVSSRRYFNKTNMEVLIRSGYFEEFGSINKLLFVYKEFRDGSMRYSAAYKDATKSKRIAALYEIERNACDGCPDALEQIKFEAKTYGQPLTISKDASVRNAYAILDVNEKSRSPKLTLYSINTGVSRVVKMKRAHFQRDNFVVGSIIRPTTWERRPMMRYVDGKYVAVPGEKEYWFYDIELIAKGE